MEKKSITEIISEFTEQSKAVARKSEELTETTDRIKEYLNSFHYDVIEQKKITAENQENLLKAVQIFTHHLENTQVKTELKTDEKKSILSLQKHLKIFNWSLYGFLGLGFISLIMFSLSIIFALKFYKVSIQTKQEVRTEIALEMKKNGERIYREAQVSELESDMKIVKEFIKENPKQGKEILKYRALKMKEKINKKSL